MVTSALLQATGTLQQATGCFWYTTNALHKVPELVLVQLTIAGLVLTQLMSFKTASQTKRYDTAPEQKRIERRIDL